MNSRRSLRLSLKYLGATEAASAVVRESLVRFLRVSPTAHVDDENVGLLDIYIKLCSEAMKSTAPVESVTGRASHDVLGLCHLLVFFTFVPRGSTCAGTVSVLLKDVGFMQEQTRLATEGGTRGLELFPLTFRAAIFERALSWDARLSRPRLRV